MNFALPKELEAHVPPELRGSGRDDVRMIVSDRASGRTLDAHFRELPQFLRAGDLLVLNTSATLPAALTAIRDNDEEIALHWSTSLPGGLAVVEPRKVVMHAGDVLALPGGGKVTLLAPYRKSSRLWIAQLDINLPIAQYLHRWGRPIRYPYVEQQFPIEAYQTVYAQREGSAEMPSAGRAFTRQMLACLRARGVGITRLVLHTGVASLESHEAPYDEWYEVPHRTAERVRDAKEKGGRVIAIGTTVVRALESSVDANGDIIGSRGWTDVVITPERGVRVVDGLLTGLHEPRATHIAMLEAIGGRATIERAYEMALEKEYLWHEFGDLHLIV